MATVMGPIQTLHAPKIRPRSARPASTVPSSSSPRSFDPFYGQEELAGICSRYITHLFQCPALPPNNDNPQLRLPYYIAYALNRTKLPPCVAYCALVLLSRLKARFPSAKGSSGHRLFISAFMISSKVNCDDTYSNKSWSIVAQNLFVLREVNQMEQELVNYLDYELVVDPHTLTNFETAAKRDFAAYAREPFPRYPLDMISKRARETRSPSAPPSRAGLSIDTACVATPFSAEFATEEAIPRTPEASNSTSTSPASTPSPETPIGVEMEVYVEGGDDYHLCIRRTSALKSQFSVAGPSVW